MAQLIHCVLDRQHPRELVGNVVSKAVRSGPAIDIRARVGAPPKEAAKGGGGEKAAKYRWCGPSRGADSGRSPFRFTRHEVPYHIGDRWPRLFSPLEAPEHPLACIRVVHIPLRVEREVIGEGQKGVLVLVFTGGERRDLVFRDLPMGSGLGLDLGLGSGLAAARAPTLGIGSVHGEPVHAIPVHFV